MKHSITFFNFIISLSFSSTLPSLFISLLKSIQSCIWPNSQPHDSQNVFNLSTLSCKNADEEQTDYLNKYEEEYDKIIFRGDNNYTDKEKELQKNYYNEENKKFEYRKHNLQKGFQLLNKWFFALWD